MNPVKVQSIDSLRVLRAALCKFVDAVNLVLSESEGELQRALNWLQTEADSHWQGQIRSRQTGVVKAKEALRAKKLYAPTGARPSVVDEEKAVRLAIARLQEAEGKLVAVHRYEVVLQKELMQYKGQAQRLANMVAIDLPIAIGRLDALLRDLEAYVGVKPAEAKEMVGVQGSGFSEEAALAADGLPSMARKDGQSGEESEKERGREGEKAKEATNDETIRNPKSEIQTG